MLTYLPTHYKHWLTLLITSILCVLTHILFAENVAHVEFEHHALDSGEVWRLFTHALWHTNFYHLGLNISGMILLWALHGEHYTPLNTFTILCWCVILSGVAVWLFAPHINHYVGLSAALHGLFCYGAIIDIQQKRYSGFLLLIGMTAKLYLEQQQAFDNTANLIEANVAYDAHIFGAIAGTVYAMLYLVTPVLKQKLKRTPL